MSSTVAPHTQPHELEPHIRVGRARSMVILFIISDLLSVFGILAAASYLRSLNTENQFRIAGDHPPALLPGLLVAIALVLSGLVYYWWARRAPRFGETGPSAFFMVALILMFLALVGQIWVTLSLGYTTTPFHTYESLLMLIAWYTWAHFLLAVILGILMLGRILRGRLAGFGFMAEVAGYWWYYTILSALLLWIVSLVL
jgi:hypothetical protein